jgi:LacI family transcriptional regulator
VKARRQPEYLVIAEDMRARILGGAFAQGRLPAERSLATAYGVNRLTLRKGLKILFDEGLIAKLGQRGTFVATADAIRGMATARRVALVIAGGNIHNRYFGAMIEAVRRHLQERRIDLTLHLVGEGDAGDSLGRLNAVTREADGFIVAGYMTPALLRKIRACRLPTVLIGRIAVTDPLEDEFDQVAEDGLRYGYEGTQCLLAKGYRRIGFVDAPAYQWSVIAEDGYRRAHADAGLEVDDRLIMRADGDDSAAGMRLAETMARDALADALLIRDESIARGIVDALARNGDGIRGIPLVVFGHPGDSVSHLGIPRIEIQPRQLAEMAVTLLMRRLALPGVEIRQERLMPMFVDCDRIPRRQDRARRKRVR